MVLWPDSECRILVITLGSTFDGDDGLFGAIDDGGNLACNAHAARGILVELALAGVAYDFRLCHLLSFRARMQLQLEL